jgi:hypothetical protein
LDSQELTRTPIYPTSFGLRFFPTPERHAVVGINLGINLEVLFAPFNASNYHSTESSFRGSMRLLSLHLSQHLSGSGEVQESPAILKRQRTQGYTREIRERMLN